MPNEISDRGATYYPVEPSSAPPNYRGPGPGSKGWFFKENANGTYSGPSQSMPF